MLVLEAWNRSPKHKNMAKDLNMGMQYSRKKTTKSENIKNTAGQSREPKQMLSV